MHGQFVCLHESQLVIVLQVKTPVVDKLRGMKCGGELSLKKILASSSEKLTIQGQADDVVAMVMSLYTVVFQVCLCF